MSDEDTKMADHDGRRSSRRKRTIWLIAITALAVIAALWFWPSRVSDTGPVFADPQNACQEALDAPPLSDIHEYLSGRIPGEYSGQTFQNLLNRILIEKNCTIADVREYMDHHCQYVRERQTGTGYLITYDYVSPDESVIASIIRLVSGTTTKVSVRFDSEGEFTSSAWGKIAF